MNQILPLNNPYGVDIPFKQINQTILNTKGAILGMTINCIRW